MHGTGVKIIDLYTISGNVNVHSYKPPFITVLKAKDTLPFHFATTFQILQNNYVAGYWQTLSEATGPVHQNFAQSPCRYY